MAPQLQTHKTIQQHSHAGGKWEGAKVLLLSFFSSFDVFSFPGECSQQNSPLHLLVRTKSCALLMESFTFVAHRLGAMLQSLTLTTTSASRVQGFSRLALNLASITMACNDHAWLLIVFSVRFGVSPCGSTVL